MGRFARSRAPMFRDVVDVNAAVSETRAYLAAGPVRKSAPGSQAWSQCRRHLDGLSAYHGMTPAGTEATLAWSRFIRRLTDHRS